jgi:hypothetical protein
VNGINITGIRCPHCGHLIDPLRPAEDDPGAETESLRWEIRLLRETVAYLRGSLGSRVRPGPLGRSLCEPHKERHGQFVLRTGCSAGAVPRNNRNAGIRDYPETP